jgi:hypothetical protein
MVVMHGPNGCALAFTIDGYEYPGKETGYDANWLFVRVDIKHSRGDWWFRSAWMTTVDARRLAQWLEDAASGRVDHSWTTYSLLLTLAHTPSQASIVSATFTRKALPHWHSETNGRELVVPLGLNAGDVRAFAADWTAQLSKYPVRGECR